MTNFLYIFKLLYAPQLQRSLWREKGGNAMHCTHNKTMCNGYYMVTFFIVLSPRVLCGTLNSSNKYNQQHPGNQQFSPTNQLCLIREPVPELSKELPPWSLYQLFFASRGYLSSWSSKFHLFLYLLLSSKHFLRFWLLNGFWLNQGLNRQTFQQHLKKRKSLASTTQPQGYTACSLLFAPFTRIH